MQGTLYSTTDELTLRGYVDVLRRHAVERGTVHPDTALHAARATSRRLAGELGARPIGRSDARRVRAYFYAVLRNSAFERSHDEDATLRDRLKVAALVADLRAADASDACIRREVEAFFGRRALAYLVGAAAVS